MSDDRVPRILVVDDQAANLRVLDLMVSRLGYRCDCASDGLCAVERFEAGERYAAVLMDGQMPRLDGYSATERIRVLCQGETPRLAVLALTAAPTDSQRMRATAAGMDDFLEKPISMTALREKLALWVEEPLVEVTERPPKPSLSSPAARPLALSVLESAAGFDPNVLCRLARLGDETGEGVAEVVVGLVLRELPRQLIAINEALAAGDNEALLQTVHRLGGAARNVGAVALAEICGRAERTLHAASGGYEQIDGGFGKPLLEEAARVAAVLRELTGAST